MITYTKPDIETQPATPSLPDKLHEETRATSPQPRNIALAGLQLLVGYEWLVSGGDKLLFGMFPAMFPARLGGLLSASVSGGQLPSFFAAILRGLVLCGGSSYPMLCSSDTSLSGARRSPAWC